MSIPLSIAARPAMTSQEGGCNRHGAGLKCHRRCSHLSLLYWRMIAISKFATYPWGRCHGTRGPKQERKRTLCTSEDSIGVPRVKNWRPESRKVDWGKIPNIYPGDLGQRLTLRGAGCKCVLARSCHDRSWVLGAGKEAPPHGFVGAQRRVEAHVRDLQLPPLLGTHSGSEAHATPGARPMRAEILASPHVSQSDLVIAKAGARSGHKVLRTTDVCCTAYGAVRRTPARPDTLIQPPSAPGRPASAALSGRRPGLLSLVSGPGAGRAQQRR